MTATTVTPEMVRVDFLRRMGNSCFSSCGVKMLINSEFEGTFLSWCFPAVFIFKELRNSLVGLEVSFSFSMISLSAKAFSVKVNVPI